MPPITVMIKPVSGACNMRCRYCFYADEMKRRTRSSAITKKFRQSLITVSDGIFLMRPLTDFSVPRSPHPQPFKENSFLLSIQMAVCQSQFVGNFHAARRSGDSAQARFAQRNIHLVPDVLLDTCSRSRGENIREDQAVKEALDTPFNKLTKFKNPPF